MNQYITPEAVLISATGMAAFAVHNKNVNEEKLNEFLTKPLDKNFENKYRKL